MAYDADAVDNLVASVTSNGPTVRETLNALKRIRPLLIPELATNEDHFVKIEAPKYSTYQGAETLVDADVATIRTDVDTAIDGLADIIEKTEAVMQPTEIALIGGEPFTLVKNWDFGTRGSIRNTADLAEEFQFHDPFGSVANGSQYGTTTVATDDQFAIDIGYWPELGFDGRQPSDPGDKFREFTEDSMIAHVKPFVDGESIGPATEHNGGNGSICSKFHFDSGGSDLGLDIVWEIKFRMVNAPPGYWLSFWTCGEVWNSGPEYDVIESYSDTIESGLRDGNAFHMNSVGGEDERFEPADSWWLGMSQSGMPGIDDDGPQNLKNVHTLTWVYKADNSAQVYMDGYQFQESVLEWRVPGTDAITNMYFIHDLQALQTAIWPINEVVMPDSDLPLSYELFHSRVWTREP